MTTINILTIFPNFYNEFIDSSIIKRAIGKGIVKINVINIRDYSLDKNHRVDDRPIGGGAGLIMMLPPLVDALKDNDLLNSHKILMTPKGKTYTQDDAKRLASIDNITLICGHYEGIDSRFDKYVDEEISTGDYVLTGGEIPAMIIADSVIRLLKGAIADESTIDESFNGDLLEYPQYTYPREYDGMKVPDILFCGNHEIIAQYHRKQSLKETYNRRKDLLKKAKLDKKDLAYLKNLEEGKGDKLSKKELEALEKGKRFI